LERGCVQSTSRSMLEIVAASGVFQQVGFVKPLRLVPPGGAQPRSGAVPECGLYTLDIQLSGIFLIFGLLIEGYEKTNLRFSHPGLHRNGSRGHSH
jgi:hypothetical protein